MSDRNAKIGLVRGRHELPVQDYVFEDVNYDNIMDFEEFINDGLTAQARNWLNRNIMTLDSMDLYVTGFTPALTGFLIEWNKMNPECELNLMHFDRDSNSYVKQRYEMGKEMGAEEDGGDYTCVVTFMFKDFTLENPIFKTKEDGSFNLDPINIITIKFLILDDLNLEGVDYDDATLTADSILFKFNFTNKIDAERFMENFKAYILMPERDAELKRYFNNVGISVRSKYQAGLIYSNMMSDIFQQGDLYSMNMAVDFLEYLSALEVEDYKYSLEVLKRKGFDSQQRDEFGLSLADILLLESNGYKDMMSYLINEIQNKGRSIDKIYFILVSEDGLQNRINATLFQIQQEVNRGVVSKVLSEQYFRNLGKRQALEEFLYYMYGDDEAFVFDNI